MTYFPFSELLAGNYFVFHPDHWGSNKQHQLFKKIDATHWQNPATKSVFEIPFDQVHSTKVAFIEVPRRTA